MSAKDDAVAARAALEIVHRVLDQPSSAAQFRELKRQLEILPGTVRLGQVETLVLSRLQETTMNAIQATEITTRRDRIGLAIAGALFLLLMLGIAVLIPTPTRFQERTFVVAMALAAGAVGGFLPGAIAVEGRRPNLKVRASGAVGLAVFVILAYRWLL